MGTPVVAVRDIDIDAVLRRVYSVKPLPIPILRGSLSISVEIRFLSNDWLEQKMLPRTTSVSEQYIIRHYHG